MSQGTIKLCLWLIIGLTCSTGTAFAGSRIAKVSFFQQDTTSQDTLRNRFEGPYVPDRRPTYEQKDRFGDPFSNNTSPSPLLLQDPASMNLDVEIDTGMNYTIYEKIGDINYRPTTTMSFEEFNEHMERQIIKNYWQERSAGLDGESAVSGRQLIPKLFINPVFDRIFGGSYVDIQPNGFVNLDFGARFQRIDNPAVPVRQQRNGGFEFDQQISMNVLGKIGDKLAVTANFDNNNSFDFQNNLKVEYTGYEEDIIKKIEIGNVSMPIANSLITGGQSLFGIKAQLQFGKLFVTGVASRQQGRNEVISVESGFQGREFEVRGSNYDDNRHFFLGHFFRNRYEQWLDGLPQILSGVNITRVEVYVLNRNNDTQTLRNVIGLMDLGEGEVIFQEGNNQVGNGNFPEAANGANELFGNLIEENGIRDVDRVSGILEGAPYNFTRTIDFERITAARKLDQREYVLNPQLGYISLLRRLQNDEVLAVAYEYTFNGQRYKVGELTEDYANRPDNEVLIMKLLRPTQINTRVPTWDLMMKNVYNLGANQIERDGFTLRIHYRDDLTGIDNPSLHQGARTKDQPLIRLLSLDQLNPNNDPQPDGNFDFIEGITIDTRNGNIIFPVLEPFGTTLESFFNDDEADLVDKFVYDTLYRTTKADAELVASKNKYFILGRLNAGSSNEIVLPGINIAEGSVIVTAGNTPLTEGLDYTVDYNLGKVRIINESILSSGKKIDIAYEKADLFNFQTRWLTGARFDYRLNDRVNFGATILHLNERPGGISRFSVGNEPTKNTKYGFDVNATKESRTLTKIIDAVPFITTKEKSTITFSGEFAQILPGTSNIVDGEGTSYVDDFESAATPFNLGGSGSVLRWKLASVPLTEDNRFDVSGTEGILGKSYRRAKLAWYSIDNVFYRSGGPNRPDNITEEDLSNNYVRQVIPQEIFQQQDQQVINTNLPIFDMAYFPSERGQFNYNPNLNSNGTLPDPRGNWGGITQGITSDVDFDKTNIEYVEFWMMDPFITGPDGRSGLFDISDQQALRGGELYFNIGNVSEDVIKDDRHGFENGLPADGSLDVIETEWGRVTNSQFLTEFFDNTEEARPNQDVGLDGLRNEDEADFHRDNFIDQLNVTQDARSQILGDPSADNFVHYLDPIHNSDNLDNKIIDRYKNWNGTDGNSPLGNNNNFTTSATNLPDNEDLNNDNTMTDLESYYEYRIPLSPQNLQVGRNNIVDEIVNENGVKWYLFRIPVRNPTRIIGDIQGFKSMRYIRTYLTGFADPVVLRLAKFQMVGSQWRKFNENLFEKGFNEVPEENTSDFLVSVVNIEENSTGSDRSSPYEIPPGITRDRDNTSPIFRRINEQSLQVCVDELKDQDARAVYKNVDIDLINYGRIQMFLHAEGANLEDDEVTGFLRLGTDFVENFYEIEVPLKVTPFGTRDSFGPDIAEIVWPEENEIDIKVDDLLTLKARRDRQNVSPQLLFSDSVGRHRITVRGRPDISSVQVMMIGVRNPESIDKESHSMCLWANELRVTDFNKNAGYAANGRLNLQLADLGNLTTSARYVSNDFGGIQQRIAERTREETKEYDVSANLNIDKMIPGNHGVKIPMFVSYEKSVATPKFDPTDPDTPLENSLDAFTNPRESEEYLDIVQDRSERRSINFTNVRKEKTNPEAPSRIYDVENLSLSYSFSELTRSNVNTESYVQRSYQGGLGYNFSPAEVSVEPLKNVGFLDSPWLKLIKDFNFSPIPNNMSFRADLDRRFTRTQLRNGDLTTEGIDPFFEKYFTFNRLYNMRWNLTRSLSLDYSARVNAIIDEPEGDLDTREKRDSLKQNLKNLGRMKNFNQNVTATYRVPLDKFPVTDWTSADIRYSAGYIWTAGAIGQSDTLGNVISNNRERGLNSKIDLVKLYNKVSYLKEINTPARRSRTPSRGRQPTRGDTTQAKTGTPGAVKGLLRMLMSLRSINVNYSIRESTTLPGFRPRAFLFGLDSAFDAPGAGFIFGSQDPEIRFRAGDEGWLATSTTLTTPFVQSKTIDLSLRAQIEPFRDLKIQLDAKRTETGNFQEIYRFDDAINDFNSFTPSRSGGYTVSFFSLRTAFQKNDTSNNNQAFQNFEAYREIIRSRLNALNPVGEYGPNSQDVLIPSFIAAYGDKDPDEIALNPFPKTPVPNWRLDYAGLSRIASLSEIFSSINITHSYQSTYSVGNFTNSLLYDSLLDLTNDVRNYPLATESNENGLVPFYVITDVTISERFAPLIGINVRTKTRLTARIEYRKERNLALQLSNSQISEMRSSDFSIDFGYTKSEWKIPFRIQGRTVSLKNDITFRVNFTIRDTETIQRKIDDEATVTQGNINFQLRPTISYIVNERLNVQAFFERTINEPRVSNSFKRASTAAGIQVRFSLSQ